MVLELIYVVRHGYRSNWIVNSTTGVYTSSVPSPTKIASDPALAAYGVDQARQLASRIASLDPPVDIVYSSPFYRCLQTLGPTVEVLKEEGNGMEEGVGKGKDGVRVENGISEFFGTARFTHPAPAPVETLMEHFSYLSSTHKPAIKPTPTGETLTQLHDRFAYALHHIIASLDAEPTQPRAVLLCTHAAGMICIGRALTGEMPEDPDVADFACGTCALSVFVRRKEDGREVSDKGAVEVEKWDESRPNVVPETVTLKVVKNEPAQESDGKSRNPRQPMVKRTFRNELSHPGNKKPSSTNAAIQGRKHSVTNVENPLSLRSTNSLPTPTPETVTILEDIDGSGSEGEKEAVDETASGIFGPNATVDWTGNKQAAETGNLGRGRGSSSGGGPPAFGKRRSSSGLAGRRASLRERISNASGGNDGIGGTGHRGSLGSIMTAHAEEEAIV